MLSPAQKRFLSGKAHLVNPVVIVGKNGLSKSVLDEIDSALKSHELIKIRFLSGEKEEREAALESICGELSAYPVKHIGKILIIYRQAEKPGLILP
ncbi:MAG: YhbY family RNA-binding protein [Burkholderiales bacterium]